MSEADRLFTDGEAYERLMGRKNSRVPIGLRQPSDCRELLDQEIYSLVQDIDRNGYAVLTEYISRADIDVLRHFVRDAVAAAGNSYTMLSGPAPVAGTVLAKMASGPQTCLHARI